MLEVEAERHRKEKEKRAEKAAERRAAEVPRASNGGVSTMQGEWAEPCRSEKRCSVCGERAAYKERGQSRNDDWLYETI